MGPDMSSSNWSIWELKQQQRRRLPKRHLKSHAASNFIALIPSRLIRQMMANFFGVEF